VVSLDRDEDGTAEETGTFAHDGDVAISVTFSGTLSQTVSSTYNDLNLSLASSTYAGVTENFSYDDDDLLVGVGRVEL
jgi:hypothetical protein